MKYISTGFPFSDTSSKHCLKMCKTPPGGCETLGFIQQQQQQQHFQYSPLGSSSGGCFLLWRCGGGEQLHLLMLSRPRCLARRRLKRSSFKAASVKATLRTGAEQHCWHSPSLLHVKTTTQRPQSAYAVSTLPLRCFRSPPYVRRKGSRVAGNSTFLPAPRVPLACLPWHTLGEISP